ncbi:MAG: hypothetical protein ACI4XM_00945 [Candidatus Coprovivens sp.]
MKEKIFHELSNCKQNDIRREYKLLCKDSYNYSIRLYVLYVILGILSIIGLIISLYIDLMIGSIIFVLSFILMIINIYFLNLSNKSFYKFLKKKGYKYDKRDS